MHSYVFRDFSGINTQAHRQAIKPDEFSWIENIMPIGPGNLTILKPRTGPLATLAHGTCYFMKSYNLNGLNYMFMATSAGYAYQVGLDSPYNVTTIGSAFSVTGLQMAQWKNERIIIVDPTLGYFSWDGSILTQNGSVVSVTMTNNGSAYTSIPSVTFTGGGGAGATASAIMELAGAQTITAAGTGYVAGDIITLVGGTFTTVAKLRVVTIGGGGSVASVSIFQAGSYTVLAGAPVSTSGGTGTGCTITPAYDVQGVKITNGGTVPYASAPTVVFGSGAAAGTAVIMDGPQNGQHVEVFSGRVWVSVGRTLFYSAPDSYTDFSGTGSGSTPIADPTLHSDIKQLISANNFLYFTGIDSVNVIGDVSVNINGDTVFSNTNLSASVGTDLSMAITPYFRSIWLMNESGIYSIYGSTPAKASDNLDGIFRNIDFTGSVSGGSIMLENILCTAFMFQYVDSVQNTTRPIIAIFFNKKWFIGSQQSDLTIMAGGENGGVQNLYATDGTNLYQLFADSNNAISWLMQGAYWDFGDLTKGKQVNSFGFECDLQETLGTVTFTIDTLNKEPPYIQNDTATVDINVAVTWQNNADAIVAWQNNAGAIVEWEGGSGYYMNMQDGTSFGKYIGVTLSSSNIIGSFSSVMLRYIWREDW